jgi:hypothetical protein
MFHLAGTIRAVVGTSTRQFKGSGTVGGIAKAEEGVKEGTIGRDHGTGKDWTWDSRIGKSL